MAVSVVLMRSRAGGGGSGIGVGAVAGSSLRGVLFSGSVIVGLADAAVAGRACVLVTSSGACPSSASSVISSSFRREEPLEEELLEGAAVCREQAEARAASLSSSAVAIDNVVSWGVNLSSMAVKWTATRAAVPLAWLQAHIERALTL